MGAGELVPLVGSFLVLALVLLAIEGTVGAGALDRNGLVGIRTRATRASDEAWLAGHRAAQGALRTTGRLCAGVGLLLVPLALVVPDRYAVPVVLGSAGLGYLALAAGLVVTVRRADAAARGAGGPPP